MCEEELGRGEGEQMNRHNSQSSIRIKEIKQVGVVWCVVEVCVSTIGQRSIGMSQGSQEPQRHTLVG
jgi:hypothetical protein